MRFEVDHPNPFINKPRVLPCADVLSWPIPTGKQPIIVTLRSEVQPGSDRIPRRLCDLKRYRSPCLLLNDD